MEKGKAKRGSVDENMDCERPSVIRHTDKIEEGGKSVVKKQIVVDGRLTSAIAKTFAQECNTTTSEEESERESQQANRKRKNSNSSSTSSSKNSKKARKKKAAKKRGKVHKPHDPYYSYDARDTETRINMPGEEPDMTVGLVENGEYEVEKVVKRTYQDGQFLYWIKWTGWLSEYNTWETVDSVENCPGKLREFEKENEDMQLQRFRDIAGKVPELEATSGKYALYERNVIVALKEADYRSIYHLQKTEDPLPSLKMLCNLIGKQEKTPSKELALKIKNMLLKREAVRLRYEQQRDLKAFADSLNKVNNNELIFIENEVDLGGPHINFKVIKENRPFGNINIPNDPLVGCECKDGCCSTSECCSTLAGDFEFPYAKATIGGKVHSLLQLAHGKPVYECNKRCACGDDCINRVVQKGSQVKLKIYKTKNMGWGVKAMEDIPQGEFVCEYVGEVISRLIVNERKEEKPKEASNYIFDLDFNPLDEHEKDKNLPYAIDAASHGNISHFINHSCDPNLGVYAVYVDCLEPHLPRLGLFAIKKINAGDQIFFDYLAEYHKKRRIKSGNKKNSNSKKNTCQCGAKTCRSIAF